MNNSVFGKTTENMREHRRRRKKEKRRNYLMSEANYHTTKFFSKNLLAREMKKTQIIMNMLVYLGLSLLELCKIVLYEFWYD